MRTSLINHFLAHDSLRSDATTQTLGEQVMAALQSKDAEAFMRSLNPFLASIPVILFPRTPEALYQTILHTIVAASGLTSFCEQFAGDGRADCVVTTRDTIFLIEWKVDQPAETAIAQMKRQRYSEPYKHKGKKLICVGLSGRRDRREVYDVLFSDEDE